MAKKKTTTTKKAAKKTPTKKRPRKASPKKQENPVSEVPEVFRYTVSSGETTLQTNDLDAFCREHSLNVQLLWATRNGTRDNHKGWRLIG